MTQTKSKQFRKQLILPAEHGSWSWLLVPYFVGIGVAGSFNLATLVVLVGGLALFLMRQPATLWLRSHQGRGRKSDQSLVIRLTIGLASLALLCLINLLALGLRNILWLAAPAAALLVLYMAAALGRQTSTRTLWMELAGAAGLALTAPAAMIAASGQITPDVWLIWGLMALQNVLGVLYVRLRIADTHEQAMDRRPMLWGHAVGFLLVAATAVFSYIPLLAVFPFLGFFIRALWTYPQPRPIPNIKKVGFTEIGVEVISGFIIIVSYLT
jgi:hypothetical protein